MKKTFLLFSVLLMLIVSSCSGSYKEEIQGKWYADYTEEIGAGMSALLVLDFTENYMNLRIDFPDVIYVDMKGGYNIDGNEISPLFKNTKPEVGVSPKLESYLNTLGAGSEVADAFKASLTSEFDASAGTSLFSNDSKLTIESVDDNKLVLKDEKGTSITFKREKPYVKSALPDFKRMTGL